MCIIQKIQITLIIFGVNVKLEVSCLGKNLFFSVNATAEYNTSRATGLAFLCN